MGKLKDSIKNLGVKVNGVEPSGYYVTDLLKSFGETLTGETISGNSLTEIINEIANNYTGAVTPTGKKNITDTTEVDVAEYATAQVVDANLVAENIKKDVTILGVVGTYEAEAPAETPAE